MLAFLAAEGVLQGTLRWASERPFFGNFDLDGRRVDVFEQSSRTWGIRRVEWFGYAMDFVGQNVLVPYMSSTDPGLVSIVDSRTVMPVDGSSSWLPDLVWLRELPLAEIRMLLPRDDGVDRTMTGLQDKEADQDKMTALFEDAREGVDSGLAAWLLDRAANPRKERNIVGYFGNWVSYGHSKEVFALALLCQRRGWDSYLAYPSDQDQLIRVARAIALVILAQRFASQRL
ncbi:MAG: hypothetical protein IPK26_23895 [Planctomycetes bacterium]|nr:hypothetical protein [Planctomycetota bacterium]